MCRKCPTAVNLESGWMLGRLECFEMRNGCLQFVHNWPNTAADYQIHPHIRKEFKTRLYKILISPWIFYGYSTSSTAQGGGGSFKNRKPIGEIGCCESGMAERSHWWIERRLISLTLSLTIYLPTYLSSYVSIYLSIYPSLSLSLSSNYLFIYLSIYLSIYFSVSLSLLHLSSCLSVYLSICLPVYLWCSLIQCNVV